MFMGALDATIVNIALPDIMDDLHTGLTDTSWVATVYVIAMASFIITASKLADIFGRKKIMLLGTIIFGGFSFLCMTADSLSLLITYRFFQGIGGAIITPIVLPMGIELFGKESTSRVTAAMGAFSAIAAAGGPAIGGFIINWSTYHWIFGINVPIAIISFLLILIGTRESYDESVPKHVDVLGVVFLTALMGSLTFGLLEGREYGWVSTTILTSFGITILSLILFLITEKFVKSPVVELDLFKNGTFTCSSIIYLIFGFAIIGPSLILNYFLQNVRNYSALHSAYLIIPASLSIAIGMPLATKMYKKVSARLLISIGLIVTAGGLLMLALLRHSTSNGIIVSCNIIIGLGLGFTAMAFTSSVRYLPVNKTGIGSGIVNASRYVGQAIGMALLVTILNNNVATAKHNIKVTAYHQIDIRVLSPHVKKVARQEIKKTFKDSKNNNKISSKQTAMKRAIRKAAKQTTNLPKPKYGSTYRKLYDASVKLETASHKLASIPTMSTYATPLTVGQQKIGTSIKLLAQKDELTKALDKIRQSKNDQLAKAFDNVFLITGLITLACTPLSLGTERREKKHTK